MRITTRMLQETARRTGIPLQQGSLLNYVNNKGGKSDSLLNALQAGKGKSAASASYQRKATYDRQEKAAESLEKQIGKFAKTGEKSLFEKCSEEKDYTELYREAENFTKEYNQFIAILNSSPDALDGFYGKSMQELIRTNKERLAEIGITEAKNGKLQLDQAKMKEASPESLEKVFGEKSDLLRKMQFLADKVSDRAAANRESLSSSYSRSGNMSYGSPNKYNFWG